MSLVGQLGLLGYFKYTNFETFALYLTFFPYLVAGPILRASEFLPQLRRRVVLTWENFRLGFTLIILWLIKKVVFGDNLSGFVQQTNRHLPAPDAQVQQP